ncbi:MAG: family 20 glycosylhydrolase [Chitinophagaceae bacterium]
MIQRTVFIVSLCFFLTSVYGQEDSGEAIKVIPEPVSVQRQAGWYLLPKTIAVKLPESPDALPVAQLLRQRLESSAGIHVSNSGTPAIVLSLNKEKDTLLGNEGYRLDVTRASIHITANRAAGLYYGAQTLLQLMPPAIESPVSSAGTQYKLPCVSIVDYPRFAWRGLMLDVSRHFFTKEEVKKYIDQMARYKFNVFHWHLTDDEGWRIQIKSLPRLTEVGAWKVKKIGYFGTFSPISDTDKYNYGGYYTQDDIRGVVQYAKEHFIDILPEIDIPGHSMAAVASYPELSCTPGADKYHVRSGESGFMDWTDSGIVAHYDNTLCPTNPKVYEFLDKVFSEVSSLFPFPYIHIGGDECAKTFWKINPDIIALMKKEHMQNIEEVQSYFEKKVEKIVESKGKRVIGWDEILEGGLAPNAAVMSWRGEKGGIAASRLKHEVVMSPTTYAYIDFMQGDPSLEPHVYAQLRLKKTYEFEPVPAGADAAYIKGGQANLWTEQVYNLRHAQYMTWPRAFAVSESLWSPKNKKNWPFFVKKVEAQFPRFDADSVKYSPAMYDPDISVSYNADSTLRITLTKEIDDIDLYYSVDNSFPDTFYPKYTQPFALPKDAAMLRVVSYRDGKPIGRLLTVPVEGLRKRVVSH